jgi:hypothetical protein
LDESLGVDGPFDVFISYAHPDNDYPRYGNSGWVELFYDALKPCLRGHLGREPQIFLDRDGQLTGSSVLTPAIKAALASCSFLVPIVSKNYLASDWCKRELAEFISVAESSGGIAVGTKTRVLKVIKLPVGIGEPKTGINAIDEALGYPFYQRLSNGAPVQPPAPLDPPYLSNLGTDFSRQVNQLAFDIKELIEARQTTSVRTDRPVVYLADTSSDSQTDRDRIRMELAQFGCDVLPAESRWPGSDYGQRVANDLAQARFSIHVIGSSYGVVPEDATESIVAIQYVMAGEERAKRPQFRRMLWMSPGAQATDPRQSAFVASLQSDRSKSSRRSCTSSLRRPPPSESCRATKSRTSISSSIRPTRKWRRSRIAGCTITTLKSSSPRPERRCARPKNTPNCCAHRKACSSITATRRKRGCA